MKKLDIFSLQKNSCLILKLMIYWNRRLARKYYI